VKVILLNAGTEPFVIKRGDRIAQLVIAPVVTSEFCEVEDLDETERGEGGFGHTGRE
jgi:dUTP pyrophosphatase